MIRFFGFLIRFVLSILLVVLGLVFLGPFLVKSVDQWMGKAEEYRSIPEQFQVIDRVRDWFDEKEICEVKFEDLLGIVETEGPGRLEGLRNLRAEGVELSEADIEVLGSVYRELLRGGEKGSGSVKLSGPVENRIQPSGGLTPSEGL